MTREEAIRDLRDKARYPLNTYEEAAAFVDSILAGGKGEIYLLIECDLHHGEARVTNLGLFNDEGIIPGVDLAMTAAGHKIPDRFNNWTKVIKIDKGTMIDVETGEKYCKVDETLVICSD